MIGRRQIRERVTQLLREHGIESAPVDVEALATLMGIEVRATPADDSQSGFLYRDEEGRAIIGVNSSQSAVRQRFTVAHELGHYTLHATERLHFDDQSRGFQVHLRNDLSSEGSDRLEIEANAFAAELLMPPSFLETDLRTSPRLNMVDADPAFDALAKKYEVSRRALAIRLSHLGYIAELP